MASFNLGKIKTRLMLFGTFATGGAFYHALVDMHDKPLAQAAVPVMITLAAEVAMHLSSHDLHEVVRERGRAREILENEHLTHVVGLTIAALIDEAASERRYAADRKKLESIARHVKEHWKEIPVRDDDAFADVSNFKLPSLLTGDGNTFLQVTALTPEAWQFLIRGLAREWDGNVGSVLLAAGTIQGVAQKLHTQFAKALFDVLAKDCATHGEAYSKFVLLMLGEILHTNQQTRAITAQVFSVLGKTQDNTDRVLADTGNLLSRADINEKQFAELVARLKTFTGTFVRQNLPLSSSLQVRLEELRRNAEAVDLPFRTTDVLICVAGLGATFCARCCARAWPDDPGRLTRHVLALKSQQADGDRARGNRYRAFDWEERTDVIDARDRASGEGASFVNDRHLLLAALTGSSNTARHIRESIGESDFATLLELIATELVEQDLGPTPL